jgi:L-threonylcarbamoyladenylate synthase
MNFEKDIEESVKVLKSGGIILYPTDTIWGIGCDATNENAVQKIFSLKERPEKKSFIVLVSEGKEINNYVANADKKIVEYLTKTKKPTTVIYEHAKNIAQNLISNDGTIAIRIVKDEFCNALIHQFKKPIVSTSANISGEASPENFHAINSAIKNGVDYIVQHRQNDLSKSSPSSIIKLSKQGEIEVIR